MKIFDAHCDTITAAMEKGRGIMANDLHCDIDRMKKYGGFVQVFAVFPYWSITCPYTGRKVQTVSREQVLRRTLGIIDFYYSQINENNDHITHCNSFGDIEAALAGGKIASLLSIEGGETLQGSLSNLRIFYRLGVRSMCLTWNYRNELADGADENITGGGLSNFGREVVAEMNRLGMLVDVSHLSDRGFWDVIEISSDPVIASHSNSRKVCGHRRNLTDEQILALKQKGGVMGINLCEDFLNPSGRATLADVIKHIEHVAGLAGEDFLGLGADFDGIDTTPEGVGGVHDIGKIFNELLKLNYSEEFIRKFAGLNFLRVFQKVCK